jgi:hypothetical protein
MMRLIKTIHKGMICDDDDDEVMMMMMICDDGDDDIPLVDRIPLLTLVTFIGLDAQG